MSTTGPSDALPPFRRVPAAAGLRWWREGWRSFLRAPGPWAGLAAALIAVFWLGGHLPFGGLLTQWLSLPLFALGAVFSMLLRRRWLDARRITPAGMPLETPTEGTLGASARLWTGRIGPLLLASLLVLVIGGGAGAVLVIGLGAALGIGLASLTTLSHMMSPQVGMMAGAGAAGGLMGLLLLMLLALYLINVAFWFVNTLVAIGGLRPWNAVVLSARAGFANVGAITVFTLVLLPLGLLAMLPAGLGLLVLLPVLSGASYTSYHEVFDPAEPAV